VDQIPIFPLSNVALFPHAAAPLYIFEPRYRQMTREALDGDRRIGMVTVHPDGAPEMAGDPPIYGIGCTGVITEHQQLADGRYHLLLRGQARFRIDAEIPRGEDRLYRVANVIPLEDPAGDEERATTLQRRVIAHLRVVAERARKGGATPFDEAGLLELPLAKFTDGVCQALGLPTREKQGLLEAATIEERLARLDEALAFHVAVAPGSASGDPETVH
jgi:Lon protease-like protein